MTEQVKTLLQEQINKELFSAYLYLDIANFYTDKNLTGFANWFNIQAKEEQDHAMMFVRYLQDNSVPVKLASIAAPDKAFTDFRVPLAASLEHEKFVTASINAIYDAAHEDKDFRTMNFLEWFISEQLEEETNADALLGRYDLFGKDAQGLYLLDAEMKARVYTAPAAAAE